MAECQDKEKQQRKQLQELKTENQWLIQNQKKSGDSPNKRSQESHEKQLDMLRNELKEERDKVKNLTGWKSQLSDKNKELKEELRILKSTNNRQEKKIVCLRSQN